MTSTRWKLFGATCPGDCSPSTFSVVYNVSCTWLNQAIFNWGAEVYWLPS